MRVLLISLVLVMGMGIWKSWAEQVGSDEGKPVENVKTAVAPELPGEENVDGDGDGGGQTGSLPTRRLLQMRR